MIFSNLGFTQNMTLSWTSESLKLKLMTVE